MKIFGARYEKGELHLKCEPPDGLKFVYGFKEGLYEILPQKKEKKHRSLDANAYAWVLIDQTGGVSLPAEEVPLDQVESFIRDWVGNHLGRQVKIFDAYRMGAVNIIRVYGSSDYDTAQMARFIDGLVQDAQALGIETKDPGYIKSLLDSWEARK